MNCDADVYKRQVYEYIRSVSYPTNKAKHLVGMAQMLVKDFKSEVPDSLEELVKLPGVGRKTANVKMCIRDSNTSYPT